ncbi:MAG: ParB/RepB/Spo0J family partition protein [bacterium]|nr:ParB/RepB/Spo0J family partition protein [bacterium]MDZ4296230.1 ParB/RepB/Spo0J family partition protein [Patescibacteria group bacterium]
MGCVFSLMTARRRLVHHFRDPYKKTPLTFRSVGIDRLEVISHQRKASPYHVEHLQRSMERIGFLVPLIVIRKPDERYRYVVIDGEHRLVAARNLGIRRLPVIVVPHIFAQRMMNFNIEKELNIREKGYVGLAVWREQVGDTI